MGTRDGKGRFETKYELDDEYSKFFDDYAVFVTINSRKESSTERLKAGVKAWLHWCQENDVQPFEATEDDVRSYIKAMQLAKHAETTITRRVASVSKYYHFLLTDPDTDASRETNPTRDVNLRRDYDITNQSEYVHVLHQEGRDDIIAIEYEDIQPIFDHVPGKRAATKTRNKLICMLFWQTAARSDELSRVRSNKIEWDNREITIRSAKLNRKDHPKLYQRRVWWEENLDYLMLRWKQKRSEFDPDGSSPYFFVTENGSQMNPSYMSRIVKKAAHNAGVNEPLVKDENGDVKQWLYTAHRLRHSRITHLANDPINMNLNSLRMMSGHASFDTTLTYVKADWGTARNAYFEALNE